MKNALITGAAGRIGRAVAEGLSADGWYVILADRDAVGVASIREKLGGSRYADCFTLDITDLSSVESVVETCTAKYGEITTLVNAAGGRSGANVGAFTESDPDEWLSVINLHFVGVLNCCYSVLPGMINARQGSIISVAAVEGLRGDPAAAVFSAAKASIIVFTQSLVRECQQAGVRVNTVLPAPPRILETPASADDAADVAEAIAFLASDRAKRINGSCLDISGGWALH